MNIGRFNVNVVTHLNLAYETLVTRETRKYLDVEDGWILESGCGNGQHMVALANHGYRCVGLD